MIWICIYILISYILQEKNFSEYVEGNENISDDEVVNYQLQIWLWPIVIAFAICYMVYFFLAFTFEVIVDFLKFIKNSIWNSFYVD